MKYAECSYILQCLTLEIIHSGIKQTIGCGIAVSSEVAVKLTLGISMSNNSLTKINIDIYREIKRVQPYIWPDYEFAYKRKP